jgi:hypothetical protein
MSQGLNEWSAQVDRHQGHNRTSASTPVPPVGVEPTLGTLLGGRPLPLGYGGIAMIPRNRLVTPCKPINARRFKANVVYLIHAGIRG